MTKFNILLSEDDPDDLFIFEKVIGEMRPDINIQHTYTGQQTVARLLGGMLCAGKTVQLPCMLIADLNSPFFVVDTIREIRIYQEFDHIPIYIFSTDETEETRQLSLEAGASGFFKKPRSFSELSRIMRTVIPSDPPLETAKTAEETDPSKA
jgi:CheY-like chemotaxis protein